MCAYEYNNKRLCADFRVFRPYKKHNIASDGGCSDDKRFNWVRAGINIYYICVCLSNTDMNHINIFNRAK